jgi:hypothetical protein
MVASISLAHRASRGAQWRAKAKIESMKMGKAAGRRENIACALQHCGAQRFGAAAGEI